MEGKATPTCPRLQKTVVKSCVCKVWCPGESFTPNQFVGHLASRAPNIGLFWDFMSHLVEVAAAPPKKKQESSSAPSKKKKKSAGAQQDVEMADVE